MLGGSLTAGPVDGGGFAVVTELPYGDSTGVPDQPAADEPAEDEPAAGGPAADAPTDAPTEVRR